MAVKMKNWGYDTPKQILATPDSYVAFAIKLEHNDDLAVDVAGRKIVKAGTIFPSNDADAKGVILNDYDVTDGDKTAAVVTFGFIEEGKLPEAPSEEAKEALKMIQFMNSTTFER